LTDALGSTLELTDASAATVEAYRYEPYGKSSQVTGAGDNSQQYTGRENDGTGLYYYRNRYYLPECGRFISEDPIGIAGGMNLYAYAGGDPISTRDPTGNCGWGDDVTGFGDGISFFGYSPSQHIRELYDISSPDNNVDYATGKLIGEWFTTLGLVFGRVGYILEVSRIPTAVRTAEEAYFARVALKDKYRSITRELWRAIDRDPSLEIVLAKGTERAIAGAGRINMGWNLGVPLGAGLTAPVGGGSGSPRGCP